jgi:hypothetical protein
MKIWYAIRKPLGILIMAGVVFLVLLAIHAIPELLARLLLGMPL